MCNGVPVNATFEMILIVIKRKASSPIRLEVGGLVTHPGPEGCC